MADSSPHPCGAVTRNDDLDDALAAVRDQGFYREKMEDSETVAILTFDNPEEAVLLKMTFGGNT